MTIELYMFLTTAITLYCLIQIPTAHVSDGRNIMLSLIVALVIGWCTWPICIALLIWIRIRPKVVRDYLKGHNDPRWKDYD